MSVFSNIQSKIEYCISFFPQEFIENAKERNEEIDIPLMTFIEGISESCHVIKNMLVEFWNNIDYKSIEELEKIKYRNAISSTDCDKIIELMISEINLLDFSLLHSVRKELPIIKERNQIIEKIEKIRAREESLSDNINKLEDYFNACQYYKNILRSHSSYTDFDIVVKKSCFVIRSLSTNDDILYNIVDLMNSFINAIDNNFIINPKYKEFEIECSEMISTDINTRNIMDFKCLKLIFTTRYHAESFKPFNWFDTRYNKEQYYEGTIKSFETIIENILFDKNNKLDIDIA